MKEHKIGVPVKAVVVAPQVWNVLAMKNEASNLMCHETPSFLNVWLYEALLQVTIKVKVKLVQCKYNIIMI